MTLPVNKEPLIPKAVVVQSQQGLVSIVSDLVRGLNSELRSHGNAINSVLPVEGTWTPTLTAATPGDLTVAYTTRVGRYIKNLPFVTLQFEIQTSTWTYTTATGTFRISGMPFAVNSAGTAYSGFMTFFQGMTKANYTQLGTRTDPTSQFIRITGSGSGQTAVELVVTDFPTGGTVRLVGEITYKVLQ